MRKIFFVLSLLTVSVFAQKNINNYKYIVVPNKFDFVNKVDQYQTSSLTKFLFNKHGFTAFLAEDDLPSDLAENRCLALTAVVESSSSMFATKNVIILKDCANKTVYSSKEGKSKLKEYKKQYLYETNVGAGLPLIDTIRLLHESGENITKIRGVFSGSLSYLFNNFSEKNVPFSQVLKEAIDKGFTEPDPREDLGGNDVARKLLILARELDLENELDEVQIKNLIPENLREGSADDFLGKLDLLNDEYQTLKENQKPNHVLRYIGELSGDLSQDKGKLEVKLVSTPESTPLGSLKGSDAIFEIYTESYGEQPIVIQGAGAGASVTARGVFGDILRLAKHNN